MNLIKIGTLITTSALLFAACNDTATGVSSESSSSSSEEVSSSSISSDSQNTSSSSVAESGELDSDLYGTWVHASIASQSKWTYIFNDDGSMALELHINTNSNNGPHSVLAGNGLWSTNAGQLSITLADCMEVDGDTFIALVFGSGSNDYTLSEDCSDPQPNTGEYRIEGNTLYAPDPETGAEIEFTRQ